MIFGVDPPATPSVDPGEHGKPLCTKRTWCQLERDHDGSCVEIVQRPMPKTDFGPNAAKRRRWP